MITQCLKSHALIIAWHARMQLRMRALVIEWARIIIAWARIIIARARIYNFNLFYSWPLWATVQHHIHKWV